MFTKKMWREIIFKIEIEIGKVVTIGLKGLSGIFIPRMFIKF